MSEAEKLLRRAAWCGFVHSVSISPERKYTSTEDMADRADYLLKRYDEKFHEDFKGVSNDK